MKKIKIQELKDAREEVEEIFDRYLKSNDSVSVLAIQRKLHLGYATISNFVEILTIKKLVVVENGMVKIQDKKLFMKEALSYFTPRVRNRNKLNELNKNDLYAFVIKGNLSIDKIDMYWIDRIIEEHLIDNEKFIEKVDDVFEINLKSVKDLEERKKILYFGEIFEEGVLSIIVLQYLLDSLKQEILLNNNKKYMNFGKKLLNLRFLEIDT